MSIVISDDLLALFHARIEYRDGTYMLEIPADQIEQGILNASKTYRIGVLESQRTVDDGHEETTPDERTPDATDSEAPVSEGDRLDVVIEDQGDEGDGLARIDPGYVIFVSGTEPGDRVRIEITDVTPSYAFGEVIEERLDNPMTA